MSDFATRRVMMVDTQVRPSDVTKFPIIEAMLTVPREAFVPDALREERRNRAAALGIVPAGTPMVTAPGTPEWSSLSPDERRLKARHMEVYAGMAEAMDHEVGRLVEHLLVRLEEAAAGRLDRLAARGSIWAMRAQLFRIMSKNATSATDFFKIPANRVVELGTQLVI